MRPPGMVPKYDGIIQAGVDSYEERLYLYHLYHGRCQGCGEPLDFNEMELAHCIANTKANKRKYGKWVVNSRANLRPTHRGDCNDAQNCGNNPAKCAEIVETARIERGKAWNNLELL
jgi:hypothetical protein